jgi:hypothetical protein
MINATFSRKHENAAHSNKKFGALLSVESKGLFCVYDKCRVLWDEILGDILSR